MRRRHLLAGAGLLALPGCGLSERPYLERRAWPIDVPRPGTPGGAPGGARRRVVLLRGMQAGPGMDARGLQVRQADGSVRAEFYETWSTLPAAGAEAALRLWLESSGRFAAVLAPGSRASPERVLETELLALHADPAKGIARAALSLVVLQAGSDRVLGQHMLRGEAPLVGQDAAAMVTAMRAALAQVFAAAEQVAAS